MNQPSITLLEKIADLAEELLEQAMPLQEQFNPESFEVPADIVMRLRRALEEEYEFRTKEQAL